MSLLTFTPDIFANGTLSDQSWHTADHKYHIQRFTFKSSCGYTEKVAPYYVGYQHADGKRITDDQSSFKGVIKQVSLAANS